MEEDKQGAKQRFDLSYECLFWNVKYECFISSIHVLAFHVVTLA